MDDPAATPDPESASAARAGRTVLIVEDSPVQAELLRRDVEGAGYRVLIARDGGEGLELARSERPDAVLSDINMPVMDGYALCEAIRREESLRAIPVILVTMLQDTRDVIHGLNAGADAYLTKPYNLPTLVSRLDALLADPPTPPPLLERRRLEIKWAGQAFLVNAHGPRLLNLLVSTYENAVLQNRDLLATQRALQDLNEHLEEKVREKTEALARSERYYHKLIEGGSDIFLVLDADGRVRYRSDSGRRVTGWDSAEVLGRDIAEFVHPDSHGALKDLFARVAATPGSEQRVDIKARRRDGSSLDLEVLVRNHFADPDVNGLIVTAHDVSARRVAERRIAKLNRLYATLGATNAAIVHAADARELFARVCREAVEQGQFRMAWCGMLDAAGELVPFARHGATAPDAEMLDRLSGADVLGSPRAAQALEQGRVTYTNDHAGLAATSAWYGRAAELGVTGAAAVPLRDGGRVLGILKLFSDEAAFFDAEQVDLLEQMAGDLAYALDRFASEHRRQEAEAALRESERRYRSIFERAKDVIYMIDAEGRFVALSPSFEQVTGWASDEWLGRDFGPIVHPDDRQRAQEIFGTTLSAGAPAEFEMRILRSAGDHWVGDFNVVPLELEGRRYLYGIGRDITERRRGERELRLFRALVDHTNDAIEVLEPHSLRLLDANQQACAMLGYSRDELLSMTAYDIDPDLGPDEAGRVRHELERTGFVLTESRHRRKDGQIFPVELSITRFVEGDEYTIAVVRDITERKQVEAELERHRHHLEALVGQRTRELSEARERADAANQAKSAFLANMSHEIRTPMNGVVGLLDVLVHTPLSEHQADLFDTVRQSATTLLGILDDILDFSKIEAGRLEIERAPVSVGEVVEGVCSSLVAVAELKGVDLDVAISPHIPETVLADETRLRQIVYNLTGNAIKFSAGMADRRGHVSVRVQAVDDDPGRVRFEIADNGIGMSEQTQARLFSAFTQAEVSTTRRFGGTGLGLAICRRLVDLMGGEIAVESAPGRGSTFRVLLPLEAVSQDLPPQRPVLAGVVCIVTGGDGFDPGVIRDHLAQAGARVRIVEDPPEARRLAGTLQGPVVMLRHIGRGDWEPAEREADRPPLLLLARGRRQLDRPLPEGVGLLNLNGLRRRTLIQAVETALGRTSPESRPPPSRPIGSAPVRAPSVEEAREAHRLVLVAEDDLVNQKVIAQQLALLGYAAELAGDGAEALRMWRQGDYALLLTDLHMPEMDGYALTEAIRREERGGRRLPILALTANALRGEAARAEVAGMDDYLTKPVQLDRLRDALALWLPAEPACAPGGGVGEAGGAGPGPVDIAVLEELLGDDVAGMQELLSEYLDTTRRYAAELRAAHAADDAARVAALAHKLKSSSRTVGARTFGDLCECLERAGRDGDKAVIGRLLVPFEVELAAVLEVLPEMIESGAGAT